MTVDRWGNRLYLGWPAHHVIWIEAALTMLPSERSQAYADIADLTGRSLAAVRWKASDIRRNQKKAVLPRPEASRIEIPLPASFIRPPDMKRLMAGR